MIKDLSVALSKCIGKIKRIKPLGTNEQGLEVFFDRKRRIKLVKLMPQDTHVLQKYINDIVMNLPEGHGLILINESRGFYYIEEETYGKAVEEMFKQKVLNIQSQNEDV